MILISWALVFIGGCLEAGADQQVLYQGLEQAGELLWSCQIELGTGEGPNGAQKFRVLVDTGSSDLWLVSRACTSEVCSGMRRFDAAASSSLVYSNNRTIRVNYGGDCEVKGVEAKDRLRLAGATVEQQSFLLADSLRGSIFSKHFPFDGVLGLGSKFLSRLKALTPFEQMFRQHLIGQQLFSMYLNAAASDGGELIFGATHSNYSHWEFKNATQVGNTRWQFALFGISARTRCDDFELDGPPRELASVCDKRAGCTALVDSGTVLMLGSSAEVRRLNGQLGAFEGPDANGLFTLADCSKIDELPDLVFKINARGDELELKPREYILERVVRSEATNETSIRCLSGLAELRSEDEYPFWILGNVFLSNFHTLFDYANKQIGFVKRHRKLTY